MSRKMPTMSSVLKQCNRLAMQGDLEESVHDEAASFLRRWAEGFDDGDAAETVAAPDLEDDDSVPRVMYETRDYLVVRKPSSWAMSWNVTLSSDLKKIDGKTEAPFDQVDEPWGHRNHLVKARDLLFWLYCDAAFRSLWTTPMMPIRRDAACSHGIMHRLDCETSGPVLVAKTYRGWAWLQLQFHAHRIRKKYVCLCHGHVALREGTTVTTPIARTNVRGRLAQRSRVDKSGMSAVTEILRVAHFSSSSKDDDDDDDPVSLVEVRLWTGRLHQIRVHLSSEGYPLVSDILYGGRRRGRDHLPRFFLHCYSLGFDQQAPAAPARSREVEVRCPLPRDLRRALAALVPVDAHAENAVRRFTSSE